MTALTSWADHLLQFCDQAVSGGYLVAMVLICALQYLYQLFAAIAPTELKEQLCRQIDNAQNDLRSVSRDRTLTSLENQILRDFAGELDLDRTLDQLIRRLVEETKDGFAAYVPVGAMQGDVTLARGLSEQSREILLVDARPFSSASARKGSPSSRRSRFTARGFTRTSPPPTVPASNACFWRVSATADDLAGVIRHHDVDSRRHPAR